MGKSPKKRHKDFWLIVLSALDVITGVLSLVFTALAVQVIAVMASGLTLMKAVKVAIQSEKTAVFVKPVAVYAVTKITRSEKMKKFFEKLKENVKNNPITLLATIIELVVCGGLGYALISLFGGFAWAVGWKLYASAIGTATVVYAAILVLTVYLGHDNAIFAAIRKAVAKIGGDKAVEVLDITVEEVNAALEAAKKAEEERLAEEAKLAEQKAKDEEIWAKVQEEEKAAAERIAEEKARKEEAIKRAKIAAYRASHPEE